jgi:RNA polymerase sigma-70 factor (ECF subfamily)
LSARSRTSALDRDPRDDRTLVDAANRGESSAFESLYLRHRDWMYAVACRTITDRDLAADAVHEAVRYWMGKFPGFVLVGEVRTFLYPVIRHAAIRQMERARRASGAAAGATDPAAEPSGPAGVGAADLARVLAEAVALLSEGQREAVHLRFAEGLSLAEIAEALHVPVGTVKSRLSLAMKALRERPELAELL